MKTKIASLLEALKCAGITFAGIVGIIGMFLMYAPDNVIRALYLAGFACGAVVFLGKLIETRT